MKKCQAYDPNARGGRCAFQANTRVKVPGVEDVLMCRHHAVQMARDNPKVAFTSIETRIKVAKYTGPVVKKPDTGKHLNQ